MISAHARKNGQRISLTARTTQKQKTRSAKLTAINTRFDKVMANVFLTRSITAAVMQRVFLTRFITAEMMERVFLTSFLTAAVGNRWRARTV